MVIKICLIASIVFTSLAWSTEMPPLCEKLIEIKKTARFDQLNYPIETARFYNQRCKNMESIAWLDQNATLTSDAKELLNAIDNSYNEGLNPNRYHKEEITDILTRLENSSDDEANAAHYWLDILLSDAYMTLAKELYEGLSTYDEFREAKQAKGGKFEWDRPHLEAISYPEYLAEYLKLHRISRSLSSLSPDYEEYYRLQEVLRTFRAASTTYKTNTSTTQKIIKKVLINLDRFRWLPRRMEKKSSYIDINIPSYTLKVIDRGYEVLAMKTIVGRASRPTPVLNSTLTHAVLNPSWTAPQTIIRKDILESKEISAYLQNHDIRVYEHINGELYEIDPTQIDWNRFIGKKQIPYTFKTDAGETNPLGKMKFLFPNKHFVYLHDTNAPALFKKSNRALSSGCIRLSSPQKLYDYMMEQWGNPEVKFIDTPETSDISVRLEKKLPIMLRYMTINAENSGTVTLYDDIYDYDEAHWIVLKKKGVSAEY